MMKEIENTVREKFEKVYLFLCLCGNRERLEKEKTKQAIEVENEILKEDFDNRKLIFVVFIGFRAQRDQGFVYEGSD